MTHEEINYYDLLGISRSASEDEIRRAFKENLHDAQPEEFEQLTLAHHILTDPDRRREYDAVLRSGSPARPPQQRRSRGLEPADEQTKKQMRWMLRLGALLLLLVARTGREFLNSGSNASDILKRDPALIREYELNTIYASAGEIRPLVTERYRRDFNPDILTNDRYDAESVLRIGLDYLVKAAFRDDWYEQTAFSCFEAAVMKDTDHLMANRILGEMLYRRWQAVGDPEDSLKARYHLNQFLRLYDGPDLPEVIEMLNTLE